MKAYIQAFREKPWNTECQVAYDGFRQLGVECILFSTTEELSTRNPEDIVVGGMLIMSHVFNEATISVQNYNYPKELLKYVDRKVWKVKLKNIRKIELPVFIKPEEEKVATGMVVNSWDEIEDYKGLDPESYILCSDVVNFISEWRCFIRYGKLIGMQNYNGSFEDKIDISIVESAIKDYSNMPAAFSLDFGVTDDGRTILVEMNDGFSIGCYGLQGELYAKFLYSRWAELFGVTDPWNSNVRNGYVERAMEAEAEKVWDAYLSIDVKKKDGSEDTNERVKKYVSESTTYLGLKEYFESCQESEVWITDKDITINDKRDVYRILNAIIGKNIIVHLRTDPEKVSEIAGFLEELAVEESSREMSLLKWRFSEDDYLIEIMKRLPDWSEYIIRLYEDGNGVIIYSGVKEQTIYYFGIKQHLRDSLVNNINSTIDEIVQNPVWTGEDDRYFGFPVHLKFNVNFRYPDAEKNLQKYQKYDSTFYSDDEYKLKIAKQLMSAPEVKSKWMKMHDPDQILERI